MQLSKKLMARQLLLGSLLACGLVQSSYAALVSLSTNLSSPLYIGTTYNNVIVSLTNKSGQSFWLNELNNFQSPVGFTQTGNTCSNIQLAANQACEVTGTFTPSVAGTNSWTTKIAAGDYPLPDTYSTSVTVGIELALTPPTGSAIAAGGYISLTPDTATQTYTITPSSTWYNASVSLTNGPADTSSLFFSTTCAGTVDTACTVTFNTHVAGTGNIAGLTFSDSTIELTASGSNVATPSSWNVAPVVGEYMQGGVVFWVGPNDPSADTAAGYRQALVAAVSDISGTKLWGQSASSNVPDAQYRGLFQGASGTSTTPTGLTNTNAICNQDSSGTPNTCKVSDETSYPAAQAAQSYTGGGKTDWFLPASASGASATCTLSTGELCEMYMRRDIINATATANYGSAFNELPYWSSSEYADDTTKAWFVDFNSGLMDFNYNKDNALAVRPVRAFSY